VKRKGSCEPRYGSAGRQQREGYFHTSGNGGKGAPEKGGRGAVELVAARLQTVNENGGSGSVNAKAATVSGEKSTSKKKNTAKGKDGGRFCEVWGEQVERVTRADKSENGSGRGLTQGNVSRGLGIHPPTMHQGRKREGDFSDKK